MTVKCLIEFSHSLAHILLAEVYREIGEPRSIEKVALIVRSLVHVYKISWRVVRLGEILFYFHLKIFSGLQTPSLQFQVDIGPVELRPYHIGHDGALYHPPTCSLPHCGLDHLAVVPLFHIHVEIGLSGHFVMLGNCVVVQVGDLEHSDSVGCQYVAGEDD